MDRGGTYPERHEHSLSRRDEGILARKRMKESFEKLMALGDDELRRRNIYQIATNPVAPKESGDALYRRLENVKSMARNRLNLDVVDVRLYSSFVDNIQIRMENRKMTETEYSDLSGHETSYELYNHLRELASEKS